VIKKLIHLILTLSVLAGLGEVLLIGLHKQHAKTTTNVAADDDAAAIPGDDKPAEFTVRIDEQKTVALAIATKPLRMLTWQATRLAFGHVIDPSPLVTLDGDLATAEAALTASKAESERTATLALTNDASRQSTEAAAARFLADKIRVDGIIRNAQLQWGALFSRDAAKRGTFINGLVSGSESLIRVDVMPGDALAEIPSSAQIVMIGRESEPISITDIQPATVADPKTQAQGFILRVVKPPFTLRPGMALTAWLELPGKPRAGFAVPRSAVLRHDGRSWVYVQRENDIYVRIPISLEAPLSADDGWFITEAGGLADDDPVVVLGASSLLSEELKAQGGAEPD